MITIIDYNAGNIISVKRALDYLGVKNRISNNPKEIRSAERLIFPGVGHAAQAMQILTETGIGQALKEAYANGTPIMGICLGTQIIMERSEEGETTCLGLIAGGTIKFDADETRLKIPHMGWNGLKILKKHICLDNIDPNSEFYFVHSYYVHPQNDTDTVAYCDYGIAFPAVLGRDNLFAVQFHPEKSAEAGLQILKNFSVWTPEGGNSNA